MCGRFAQAFKHDDLQKLARELKLNSAIDQLEISYNVAPTHTVMAIVRKEHCLYSGFFSWGLVPGWMQAPPKSPMINARAESIFEKPSFRAAIRRRRAIIPVNGFYEWRQSDKQPFFVYAADEDYLYLGAIYELWEGADGSYLPTIAIITTAANEDFANIHHRMPLILTKDDRTGFLNANMDDKKEIAGFLRVPERGVYLAHPVSKRVNKVQNNDISLTYEIKGNEQMEIL